MSILEFVSLLRKHLVVLLITPVLLAGLVVFMTRHPDLKYASETKLFTGITTGTSVELEKSLSYFATSTSFDNLINIIKSRKTQQEVAVKLLAQHLMLKNPDPKYISAGSFSRLKHITPSYVRKIVDDSLSITTSGSSEDKQMENDSVTAGNFSTFADTRNSNLLSIPPNGIDPKAYRRVVSRLTGLMNSSDTNFVYKLLNFNDPHYSIKAISSVNVQRIGSSDLVQLKYETDDPGICQQTLALMVDACIHNYKNIKENQSDMVVRYFELQLTTAAEKLKVAEDKLLEFNKENNIINYYEQSKAVAIAKETLDADFNNMKIKLAGIEAAINDIEQKLGDQKQIQLKSTDLLSQRDKLGELSYKIANAEANLGNNENEIKALADLKSEAEKLKEEIRNKVNEFYKTSSSVEGLPVSTLLQEWIANVIDRENTKAGLKVLGDRINDFQQQYAIYAPAGANVKRIEREITVSEGEYLEILHGLNLARLKLQDNELSSNIKTVDPPFYPLSPNQTKRKMLVMIGALAGFIIVLSVILVLEYFDGTLKNSAKAAGILKMKPAGMLPKILLKSGNVNLPYIVNRLLEISLQDSGLSFPETKQADTARTILVFSTAGREGKTIVAGNLAHKLKTNGKNVLFMNYIFESLEETERGYIGYKDIPPAGAGQNSAKSSNRISLLRLLLGYPDNRIAYDSPFLEDPRSYLDNDEYTEYKIDRKFNLTGSYKEILEREGVSLTKKPDCVIIELPPLLYSPIPFNLIENSDLPLLICRSNREWSEADKGAVENLRKITGDKMRFFLNGVDLQAIESVLGDLPKRRTWLRRIAKKFLRFQFHSTDQI